MAGALLVSLGGCSLGGMSLNLSVSMIETDRTGMAKHLTFIHFCKLDESAIARVLGKLYYTVHIKLTDHDQSLLMHLCIIIHICLYCMI